MVDNIGVGIGEYGLEETIGAGGGVDRGNVERRDRCR